MKRTNKKKSFFSRLGLTVVFTLVVFLIQIITFFVIGFAAIYLIRHGILDFIVQRHGPYFPISLMLCTGLTVGLGVTLLASRVLLRPLRDIIHAMQKLADGDFSVRLSLNGPPEISQLSESFNIAAEELGNTELLRSDFINNFSHEFKTPIVSIKGFAEMLKYDDIPPEERNRYLEIIIDESDRLSVLATNVLNLSKVEKQTILTDRCVFDVSEQIRKCVILMQPKWEKKNLAVEIDAPEHIDFCGNEEMLSQVWLNLLDNAVKFSPDGECVFLELIQIKIGIRFVIRNTGTTLSAEVQERVFDKFYQGDNSHASAGNGLGLSLVKKITELHGGYTEVRCSESDVEFIIGIPDVRE